MEHLPYAICEFRVIFWATGVGCEWEVAVDQGWQVVRVVHVWIRWCLGVNKTVGADLQ